jgi:hypothetical protein
MGTDAKSRLLEGDGAPWIADFEPAYKLSTELKLDAAAELDVTALLFPDVDENETARALRALGARNVTAHRGQGSRVVRFELDAARLADAASLGDVQWLEPSPRYVPTNDQAQWVVQTGTPESRTVWDHGLRGQGQIVMTADSGIRTNHEMFDDSTLAISGWGDYPTHRKIVAYKPGSDDPKVAFGDDVLQDYHGTHTAGTVAGNADAASGTRWSGIAKDARLYFMDVAGTHDGGFYLPPDLGDLYQPSYDGNAAGAARISSNSWGSTVSIAKYTIGSMQLDQFIWDHPDYLIAFANGNYGVFNSVTSPGTAKNCLNVGATGNGTLENRLATFTSRGPTSDGRRKPTVMAPGDGVTSSVGNTRYTYAAYSGTSMATPAVVGALALVRQYLTEGSYPTGVPVATNAIVPSAALLKAMAVAAARNDIVSYTAPDNSIGFGRLTIDDVLYFPGDALRTLLVDSEDGLEDGQFVEYQVRVTDPTQPLKVALCWSDAPGTPLATKALVNDLDLVVVHDGVTYRGNYLLNNASMPGGSRDSLNVEELVRLAAPSAGLWTVRVEGKHVLEGEQPFALCITGGVGGPNGAVALDRFDYALADTVKIEVVDADASGPVTVHVSSNTETFPEARTLQGSHGVFRGSIVIRPDAVHLADGILAVSEGDLVTVSYEGDSAGDPVLATARVDVRVPTITDVSATPLGATQAVVSWTTDVASRARVHFGPSAALGSVAESGEFRTHHSVLLIGLAPQTTYEYDVEAIGVDGGASRDSLGGAHRSFTTRRRGTMALVMADSDLGVLDTWTNAFTALGWDADVVPLTDSAAPLVGNSSAGLRSYDAVLWQVGPDTYPPFSDAQRAAIDSLVDGGGRLLVSGHDIGFGLGDAGSPAYSIERELWLESGLKSRYVYDNLSADTLTGVAGSPISGSFAGPVPYPYWADYPDAGDNFIAAPGTDGTWSSDWTENVFHQGSVGMRWESQAPKGVAGVGIWGGKKSRIVGMFFEWSALGGTSNAHLGVRTEVLERSVAWLLGHEPPEARIVSPTPGALFTSTYVPIVYSIRPDSGRAITSREIEYSLDGGDSWQPIHSFVAADSICMWHLDGALGGGTTPNSPAMKLRMRVGDDGSPSLHSTYVMSGTFTVARSGGDQRGPVLVAGTATCSPTPIRGDRPATLVATFSDAETGGGKVSAAEYSHGPAAAPPGGGIAMTGAFGVGTVTASAALATAGVVDGTETYWVRGRDASGAWGPASAITVPSVSRGTVAVGDGPFVDFLATPSPNPFQGRTSIRFGLARSSEARLELFDVTGRHVRTLAEGVLAAGPHAVVWDGLDRRGRAVGAGVYFARLMMPQASFHVRVVALN